LIASEKIKNFWSKANTVATLLQVAATGYLTGSVRAANLAMKAMFETMKLNPYVAVGVVLAAMTVGLYKLVSANKAVSQSVRSQIDIQKKADEAFQEQASNVDILVSKIKNENLSNAERIEAISKLKEIIPGYNGMIDQEGRLINDNKTAIDEYLKSLEKQIKLKAVQEELEELIRKKRLQEKQATSTKKEAEDYTGFANTSTYGPMTGGATTQGKLKALQANARNASKALEETVTAIKELENEMNSSTVSTSSPNGPKKGDQKFIDDELYEWDGKKWNKVVVTPSGSPKTALAKHENEYKKELLLFQELLRSKTISEQLYYTLSEQANINYLESKINLLKKSGEDSIDVELELSNALTKQQENDEKRAAEHKKAMDELMKLPGAVTAEEDVIIDTTQYSLTLRLKILEKFHEKGLRSESEYLNELAALYKGNQDEINRYLTDESLKQNQQEFDSGLIGRKQYLENVKNITRQYWEEIHADQADLAEKVLEIANVASNVISTIVEAETLAVENKYKKQIDAAIKNGEDTTALEEKMEEEKKNIKKKYADIDFGITIAKIISETALAIMKAAPNIPLQILTGMQGVAQLALAAQQRQQVKNLWTGGFTDPGGKYEPRGIVHAGEFVANQEAVRNNDLRRLFNLVDYAQKTNTIARIDRKLIAQTVGASGFANGGFTSGTQTPTIINNQGNDQTEILQLLNENKSLLLLLYNLLKKGITAKTYIAGDGGIEDAQDLYNTINKNKRRS
ncbi:MAG: hypothetical protein PHU68_10665, partial [Paludibacter sp.]|nr:hypothetical protein [Paludibacter sp.]